MRANSLTMCMLSSSASRAIPTFTSSGDILYKGEPLGSVYDVGYEG